MVSIWLHVTSIGACTHGVIHIVGAQLSWSTVSLVECGGDLAGDRQVLRRRAPLPAAQRQRERRIAHQPAVVVGGVQGRPCSARPATCPVAGLRSPTRPPVDADVTGLLAKNGMRTSGTAALRPAGAACPDLRRGPAMVARAERRRGHRTWGDPRVRRCASWFAAQTGGGLDGPGRPPRRADAPRQLAAELAG